MLAFVGEYVYSVLLDINKVSDMTLITSFLMVSLSTFVFDVLRGYSEAKLVDNRDDIERLGELDEL